MNDYRFRSDMPEGEIRIENLNESNLDDLIFVCSSKRMEDPIHVKGVELKKKWLRQMLQSFGPCAKIGYFEGRPVAQILYYPEIADPAVPGRDGVINLFCIYNSFPGAQKKGIGTMLLNGLIEDCKGPLSYFGGKKCKFIATTAFDTGEFLTLPQFFKKNRFQDSPEGSIDKMHLPISGSYEKAEKEKCKPLPEDKGKALIFYGPNCQFSYYFAVKISDIIKEISPNYAIELINEWEKWEESKKRNNPWLIVNGKEIETWFMDKEKFRKEIADAITAE